LSDISKDFATNLDLERSPPEPSTSSKPKKQKSNPPQQLEIVPPYEVPLRRETPQQEVRPMGYGSNVDKEQNKVGTPRRIRNPTTFYRPGDGPQFVSQQRNNMQEISTPTSTTSNDQESNHENDSSDSEGDQSLSDDQKKKKKKKDPRDKRNRDGYIDRDVNGRLPKTIDFGFQRKAFLKDCRSTTPSLFELTPDNPIQRPIRNYRPTLSRERVYDVLRYFGNIFADMDYLAQCSYCHNPFILRGRRCYYCYMDDRIRRNRGRALDSIEIPIFHAAYFSGRVWLLFMYVRLWENLSPVLRSITTIQQYRAMYRLYCPEDRYVFNENFVRSFMSQFNNNFPPITLPHPSGTVGHSVNTNMFHLLLVDVIGLNYLTDTPMIAAIETRPRLHLAFDTVFPTDNNIVTGQQTIEDLRAYIRANRNRLVDGHIAFATSQTHMQDLQIAGGNVQQFSILLESWLLQSQRISLTALEARLGVETQFLRSLETSNATPSNETLTYLHKRRPTLLNYTGRGLPTDPDSSIPPNHTADDHNTALGERRGVTINPQSGNALAQRPQVATPATNVNVNNVTTVDDVEDEEEHMSFDSLHLEEEEDENLMTTVNTDENDDDCMSFDSLYFDENNTGSVDEASPIEEAGSTHGESTNDSEDQPPEDVLAIRFDFSDSESE